MENTAYLLSQPNGATNGDALRLLALTGTVLEDRRLDLPDYCSCRTLTLPESIRLYPADGTLILEYATDSQLRLLGYA